MSVQVITSMRLMVSGLVLLGLCAVTARRNLLALLKNGRTLLVVCFFALFGLALNQLAYLQAIAHTNAATATVLQYLCPILVLAYTCLKDRQRPTGVEVISIVLAIVGTFFIATHGQLTELAITPLGLAWGLFSALTYALYIILPAQVIDQYGSLSVIGLGMLMGGLMVTFGLQTWQEPLQLDSGSMFGLVGIVGVGTIFAYTVFLKGVTMVGPVNASLLASIEPVASIIFVVCLVNEVFTSMDLVGMVCILLAVLLISLKDFLITEKSIG